MPLTQDGRLSAKEFIGGRDKMRADQTSFAEAVRDLGLERGIEGSRATHQRVQSYYGAIERQPEHATITPQAIEPRVLRRIFSGVETPEAVAARVTAAVRKLARPSQRPQERVRSARRPGRHRRQPGACVTA